MVSYIKSVLLEFVLVSVVSVAFGYVFFQGFKVGDALVATPVTAVIMVVLIGALFMIAANRRTLLLGGCAYLAVFIVSVVVSLGLTQGDVVQDSAGNWLIAVIIVALAATLPFLLSRGRAGAAFLGIAGIFICSWTQFFFKSPVEGLSLVFLLGCITLLIYKNYQLSVKKAMSARQVSFPLGFLTALGASLLAVVIGAGAWFLVIQPIFNPSVVDVKLVTEERALEEQSFRGVSDEQMVPNMDLTSDKTTDGIRTTDDLVRDDDNGVPNPARPLETPEETKADSGSFMGINMEELQDAFDIQANPTLKSVLLGLLILIPLAIVAYFVGRRLWRKRRLRNIQQLPLAEQVSALYLFLNGRLSRIGFSIPKGQTPLEFASNNAHAMEVLDSATGASYVQATQAYAKVAYGRQEATQQEADCLAAYYNGFWKAARKQLGNVKYFFRSFRL